MTSHTRKQVIIIHIVNHISSKKGNQIMKLGQLIEYNMRIEAGNEENETGRLDPDLF